jgi:hypothetical protein
VPNRTLALQASSNLVASGGGFVTITNLTDVTNATIQTHGPKGFYRIAIP